jgi:YHS domain-containing protein
MNPRLVILAAALWLAALAPVGAAAADELKPRQATPAEVGKKALCPVMNINFEVAKNTKVIDYKGKPYFFCCDHCVSEFQQNPAKWAGAGQLQTRPATAAEVGKTVTCQVMGTRFEVAKNTPVIDYKGKSYYFCCDHCVEQFIEAPDKFSMK